MKSKTDNIIAFFALTFLAAAVIGTVNGGSNLVYITHAADNSADTAASAESYSDEGSVSLSAADTAPQPLYGNMLADAYRYCANRTVKSDNQQYDIAIASALSEVDVSDKLVSVYVTGSEIKKIAELDASYSGSLNGQGLYFSGLYFEYNTLRPRLDKVSDVYLSPSMREKSRSEIDNDTVYRIVTDTLSLEMIDRYSKRSLGIIKINYDRGNGVLDITDSDGLSLSRKSVYDEYTNTFLSSMEETGFTPPEDRKTAISTLNPAKYFKNTSVYFFVFFSLTVAFILLTVIIIRTVIRSRHKKKVFVE